MSEHWYILEKGVENLSSSTKIFPWLARILPTFVSIVHALEHDI